MRTRRLIQVLAGLAAVLAMPALWAADAKPDVAATIKRNVEARFPGTKVIDVQPSPLAGIYEVFVGDRIVYSDPNGDYLLVGSLLDSRTRSDLTAARMEERGTIDFKSLPFDKAIKVVRGNGKRSFAVFEDPDCPFCQKLEHELTSMTDVTEYIFLFPIDALHPQATVHAHAIWCAPDRALAWTQWLNQKKPPPPATCKNDPIGELQKLGAKLYIDGTPTMYMSNGKRVTGAIPAADLEKELVASTAGPASGNPVAPPAADRPGPAPPTAPNR